MSRRPPSQRNAEYALQRHGRQLQSMTPGTAGGRLASASPVVPGGATGNIADAAVATAETFGASFARDRFALTSSTPALTLSYLPAANSLHAYLNGIAQDEGTDYTLSDTTLTVLSAMGAASGDVLDCRYAYLGDQSSPIHYPVLTTIVPFASTGWRYSTVAQAPSDYPTDGVEGSTAWAQPTFDDSAWSTGQAAFGWGYGGGTGVTPRNTTVAALSEIFIRRTLVGDGSDWKITTKVDNWGFLYFNGTLIPGTKPSGAISGADTGTSQTATWSIPDSLVRPDFNVVALHVQDQAGSGGYGPGDVALADMQVEAVI